MADIESRTDIEKFLRSFYSKSVHDTVIGIVFTETIPLDLEKHLPVITDFWESILLDNPVYKKNAMAVHYGINKKFPLKKIHFDAWLRLFNTSADEMYAGEKTELAKKRAAGIAALMEIKMKEHR